MAVLRTGVASLNRNDALAAVPLWGVDTFRLDLDLLFRSTDSISVLPSAIGTVLSVTVPVF